ncbi:MAG: T9SS type A sorting domain-containing protein [Bacteroidota bacterium]
MQFTAPYDPAQPYYDYVWTVTPGVVTFTGQYSSSILVSGTATGTAYITVSYSNVSGGGCTATSSTRTVTINGLPASLITGSSSSCSGGSKVYSTTATSGSTYSWSITAPDGAFGVINGSSTSTSVTITWSNTTITAKVCTITLSETNTSTTCIGYTTATVTVYPVPTVRPITNQAYCNLGVAPATPVTSPVSGAFFEWINNNIAIGQIASGGTPTDIPSFTASNTTSTPVYANINITPTANGCQGTPSGYSITVNPTPTVSTVASQSVCHGNLTTSVSFSGSSTEYTWINSDPTIGLPATGTNTIAAFTATNTGTTTDINATIVVTPKYTNAGISCTGTPTTFTITVNRSGQVNQPASQLLCNGSTTSLVTFSTTNTGGTTTYSWTNTNPTIGLASTGTSTTIAAFSAINNGTTPATATIVVTPAFNNGSMSCSGSVKTFTFTVNPSGQVNQPDNQTVCIGSTASVTFSTNNTGGTTTYSWTNSNTSIGLGSTGTSTIAFSATNTGTTPATATIVVTPTFANGSVSCEGATKTFTITVNPNVGTPTTVTITAGTEPTCQLSSGTTTTTYASTVTNGTIAYSVLPSAAGTIGAGSGIMTWADGFSGTATITAIASGCTGPKSAYRVVTVNPAGQVNQPASQVLCNGSTTTPVTFSTTNTGGTTTYLWTNTNPSIGLGATGTSTIAAFPVTNTGTTSAIATIVVTPTFTNGSVSCEGSTKSFTITVTPSVGTPETVTITAGAEPTCQLSGGTTTTTYRSTVTNGTIEYSVLPSGAGAIGAGSGLMTWTTGFSGTATITATALGCTGPKSVYRVVTVNPAGQVDQPASQVLCNGSTTTPVTFSTINTGGITYYSWTNSNTSIGLGASGTGTITAFPATNTGTTQATATIVVTPTFTNGSVSCVGSSKTFTITVNQSVGTPTAITITAGTEPTCQLSSGTTTTTYRSTVTNGTIEYSVLPSGAGTIGAVSGLMTWTTGFSGTATITATATGCTGPISVYRVVTINPSPTGTPTITGTSSLCPGSAGVVYFTETGKYNYTWTISAGGNIVAGSTTNAITVSWISAGNQTITVRYSDTPGGCLTGSPAIKTVTVISATAPPITSWPLSACTSSTVYYTAEAGMTMYQWTATPGGTIISGSNTYVIGVIWSTPGLKIVTVSYINTGNCLTQGTKSVTVNSSPNITITGDSESCLNDTKTYSTQVGQSLYDWSVPNGGTITSGIGTSAITVIWTQAGTRSVTVSYTNPIGGCSATAPTTKTVTVYTPVPVISGPTSGCFGGDGTEFSTATGMSNYLWNVTGGEISPNPSTSASTITVVWNTIGVQSVYLSYTDNRGCAAITPTRKDVTISNRPATPAITGTTVACAGSATSTYLTQSGMSGYIWSVLPGVGTITGGQGTNAILVTWLSSGTQTVAVNYSIVSGGCTALNPGTFTCVVNAKPNPTLSGQNIGCLNAAGNVYETQGSMNNYIWNYSSGGIVTAGGTSASSSVTLTWFTPGLKTVTVNYSNSSGCYATAPAVFTLTVIPLPVPSITGAVNSCQNDPLNTYSTDSLMNNYLWTVSSGGIITNGQGTYKVIVTWLTAGNQTITVTFANQRCAALTPAVKTIFVKPSPIPVITGSHNGCVLSNSTFSTEPGKSNYFWSVSSGGTIVSGTNSPTVTINWISTGTQFVSVIYTDTNAYGCSSIIPSTFSVTIYSPPVPTISGPNQVCVNSGNYTYSTEPGVYNYLWSVPYGGIIVSGQGTRSIQINWTLAGIQTVTVIYTSATMCTAFPAIMNVIVKALPEAHGPISGDTIICKPQNGVVYSVDPIANAVGYIWNVPVFANIVSGANTNIITVNFGNTSQPGNISVFGTNSCGNGPFAPLLPVGVFPFPETPHITGHEPDTLISSAPLGNQWYWEYEPIPGATGQFYIVTSIGRYFVIANPYGCVSDTSNIIEIYPVGVVDGETSTVKFYPNPADDRLTLTMNTAGREETLSIIMVNNFGQKSMILSDYKLMGEVTKSLDLGNPPSGIYHLVFQFGDHIVVRKLIIINE